LLRQALARSHAALDVFVIIRTFDECVSGETKLSWFWDSKQNLHAQWYMPDRE
jgi:hypothetical protein